MFNSVLLLGGTGVENLKCKVERRWTEDRVSVEFRCHELFCFRRQATDFQSMLEDL